MKGVLFSADFAKDENGDLKLLEVNTNTTVTDVDVLDLSALETFLSGSTYTKVKTVGTETVHVGITKKIEQIALSSSLQFTASYVSPDSLYPTIPADESDTFILRMAYDEDSLFDTEYAAADLNTLKVMYNAGHSGSIIPFYHSDGVTEVDTLGTLITGSGNLPDYSYKGINYTPNGVRFLKIGDNAEDDGNVLDEVKSYTVSGSNYVTRYVYNSSDIVDNYVKSYRYFGILYIENDQAKYISLGGYKSKAFLSIPTSVDTPNAVNALSIKHYLEYTTNYPKISGRQRGPVENEYVKLDNNSQTLAINLTTGTDLDTYFINTVPDSDDYEAIVNWSATGSTLPVVSNASSSIWTLEDVIPSQNIVTQIVLANSSSTLVGNNTYVLRYSPTEDAFHFKSTLALKPGDKVILDGTTQETVAEVNKVITHKDLTVRKIDVEDIDTYMVGPSNLMVHNSPCFVAGTLIALADGDQLPIEAIKPGMEVLSYDHQLKQISTGKVHSTLKKEDQKVIRIVTEAEQDVICTYDHPFFTLEKGYASYDREMTFNDSGLLVDSLAEGDTLMTTEGAFDKINHIQELGHSETVYNLPLVHPHHNFYANSYLVHNRIPTEPCPECCPSFGGFGNCEGCGSNYDECCPECNECFVAGTEVTLANGDVKNIEDMVVGDEVLSSSVVDGKQETQTVLEVNESKATFIVTTELENGTILEHTLEHPHIDANGQLVSYRPDVVRNKGIYSNTKAIRQLEVGTILLTEEGDQRKVVSIDVRECEEETKTYIIKVNENHNFYANGILTHNK